MDEEKLQKLDYINENIIEKGYNPEELSNFIIKKTGIPMDSMNFDQLKNMIDKFKDQSLENTYQSVKSKEEVQIKESPEDLLYANQNYDITTQPPQKNKLLELEEKKRKINNKYFGAQTRKKRWFFF